MRIEFTIPTPDDSPLPAIAVTLQFSQSVGDAEADLNFLSCAAHRTREALSEYVAEVTALIAKEMASAEAPAESPQD